MHNELIEGPCTRSRHQGQEHMITSHSFVGWNYISLRLIRASVTTPYNYKATSCANGTNPVHLLIYIRRLGKMLPLLLLLQLPSYIFVNSVSYAFVKGILAGNSFHKRPVIST